MAFVRWNPERDLMPMREEMDRLLHRFFRPGDGADETWMSGTWAPPVDLYETDEAFVLTAELPGFSAEDLQIEFHDHRLTLRGTRQRETEAKEAHYHRLERAYGRFERAFWLPTSVDAEKIHASFKDGVLELRLPKSEAAKPKRIAIRDVEKAAVGH
jgi:HSP20 family protein